MPRRPTPSSEATTSAGILRREQASLKPPSYVTSITDPTELTQVLEEHINAVLGRYGNDLYAFDVINEREC
jgi:GH35 family endo-1,4-beta-xylanase